VQSRLHKDVNDLTWHVNLVSDILYFSRLFNHSCKMNVIMVFTWGLLQTKCWVEVLILWPCMMFLMFSYIYLHLWFAFDMHLNDFFSISQDRRWSLTIVLCTPWVKKACHPNHGYNFVNQFLMDLQIKLTNKTTISYLHTLSMLLHYLGKLKNQKFALLMHVKHVSNVTFYHLSNR